MPRNIFFGRLHSANSGSQVAVSAAVLAAFPGQVKIYSISRTQTEVGEYLHISQCSYAHFEAGTRGIPVEVLAALADLYRVNVDYLIGRTDKKEMLPPSSGSAEK